MLKKTKLCTGLMVACGGVLLSAGQSALAQTAPGSHSNASRSPARTSAGPTPRRRRRFRSSRKQEIDQAGKGTVAEYLQTLTADDQGSVPFTYGRGFSGATSAGISLRGLGANATLVLINGRRVDDRRARRRRPAQLRRPEPDSARGGRADRSPEGRRLGDLRLGRRRRRRQHHPAQELRRHGRSRPPTACRRRATATSRASRSRTASATSPRTATTSSSTSSSARRTRSTTATASAATGRRVGHRPAAVGLRSERRRRATTSPRRRQRLDPGRRPRVRSTTAPAPSHHRQRPQPDDARLLQPRRSGRRRLHAHVPGRSALQRQRQPAAEQSGRRLPDRRAAGCQPDPARAETATSSAASPRRSARHGRLRRASATTSARRASTACRSRRAPATSTPDGTRSRNARRRCSAPRHPDNPYFGTAARLLLPAAVRHRRRGRSDSTSRLRRASSAGLKGTCRGLGLRHRRFYSESAADRHVDASR